jgi:hypothetical protein
MDKFELARAAVMADRAQAKRATWRPYDGAGPAGQAGRGRKGRACCCCSHSHSLSLSHTPKRPNTPPPQHHCPIRWAHSSTIPCSTSLTRSRRYLSQGEGPRANAIAIIAMSVRAPLSSSSPWLCSSVPSHFLSSCVRGSLRLGLAPAVGR